MQPSPANVRASANHKRRKGKSPIRESGPKEGAAGRHCPTTYLAYSAASMALPKERLNRIVNVVLRVHPAGQHLLVIPQVLVQHIDEVPAAIGGCNLAI